MFVVYALLGYVFFVWVLLRLIVPNLGFRKAPLPETIPPELDAEIKQINAEAGDDLDFLKRAYAFIVGRYYGNRIKTFTRFWVHFQNPVGHAPGFLSCMSQVYLLRIMLVRSGRFSDADLQPTIALPNFFIHQYLRVRVNGDWVSVDPWAAALGVPFGKFARLGG